MRNIKQRQNKAIISLVIAITCLLMFSVTMTFAFFTASNNATSNTMQFGTLAVGVNGYTASNADSHTLVPGCTINLDGNIELAERENDAESGTITSNSTIGAFVRIKLTIEPATNGDTLPNTTGLMSAIVTAFGASWKTSGTDGYLYYAGKFMPVGTSNLGTNEVTSFDLSIVSFVVDREAFGNAWQDKAFVLKIEAEAIQAEHAGVTAAQITTGGQTLVDAISGVDAWSAISSANGGQSRPEDLENGIEINNLNIKVLTGKPDSIGASSNESLLSTLNDIKASNSKLVSGTERTVRIGGSPLLGTGGIDIPAYVKAYNGKWYREKNVGEFATLYETDNYVFKVTEIGFVTASDVLDIEAVETWAEELLYNVIYLCIQQNQNGVEIPSNLINNVSGELEDFTTIKNDNSYYSNWQSFVVDYIEEYGNWQDPNYDDITSALRALSNSLGLKNITDPEEFIYQSIRNLLIAMEGTPEWQTAIGQLTTACPNVFDENEQLLDFNDIKEDDVAYNDWKGFVLMITGYNSYEEACSYFYSNTILSGLKEMSNDNDNSDNPAFNSFVSEISLPSTITAIHANAFNGCNKLTSITIPEGVTSIGETAFAYCRSLTNIVIPNSVESIGDGAFLSSGIVSITIGSGVTSIGESAFTYCSKLVQVRYLCGNNNNMAYDNYKNIFPTDNFGYECVENAVDEFENTLNFNESGYVTYTIGTVGQAGYYKYLMGIANGSTKTLFNDIPNDITDICRYAFYEYDKLTSVVIPSNVQTIGACAFYKCTSLTSVSFISGSKLEIIEGNAFEQCYVLESITIPSSVVSIVRSAFYGCTELASAIFENPNGWQVSTSVNMSNPTYLLASDLSSASTAATYLKSTYRNRYWERT